MPVVSHTLTLPLRGPGALHGPSPLLFFLPRMTPPPPPSQPGSEWIPLGPSFLPPSHALASQSSRILRDRPRSHRRLLPSPPSRSPRAVSPTSPATSDWSRIRARIQNQMAFELRQLPSRFSGNCMPSLPIGREWEAKWQSRLRPNRAEHALFYMQMIRGLVHAQVGAGRGMTNNVIQRLHCSPTHALSLSYAFVSPKQLSNQRCRQSIHLSIRFQTSENEDGWLQRRLGFVPSCFVSLVSSRKPPYATARVDTLGWLAARLTSAMFAARLFDCNRAH